MQGNHKRTWEYKGKRFLKKIFSNIWINSKHWMHMENPSYLSKPILQTTVKHKLNVESTIHKLYNRQYILIMDFCIQVFFMLYAFLCWDLRYLLYFWISCFEMKWEDVHVNQNFRSFNFWERWYGLKKSWVTIDKKIFQAN